MRNSFFALLSFLFIFGCGSGGGDLSFGPENDSDSPQSGSSISIDTSSDSSESAVDDASSTNRVWTVDEILGEPRQGGNGGVPTCGGEGGFKRCLCPQNVYSSVRYRPAVAECNGNAAAIFFDNYREIFSVVVRDSQNRDRWPASGFNGCSASLADSDSPPNYCSAFKVQDKFEIGAGIATVHCFGASGYSELFTDVTRLTIKLADDPNSSDDPLDRLCLYAPDLPLN